MASVWFANTGDAPPPGDVVSSPTPEVGHIGFTYVPGWVSAGVAFAERWNRRSTIKVTHTLVVSGASECIEAHIDEGVAKVSLEKYFGDPSCRIFFKRPRGWTPELGARIAASAATQVGCSYNTSLIVAQAAVDTWLGHWCNRLLGAWPDRVLSWALDRQHRWICSQLVAYALAQQPEFRGRGVLSQPLDTIDPQQLFEDDLLWEN
jgi:hypothetical protein